MNIVIAPDSFKENLTAMQVAEAIERGVRRVLPQARCIKVPLADGGEGTVRALVDATGGRVIRKSVTGPLGRPVSSRFGLLGDGRSAVIEVAMACGLPLVPPKQRNPLKTTSYGVGELIRAALARGVSRIIIGLGGSATNDGGAGMAQALGVEFRDARGRLLKQPLSGGTLDRVARIDAARIDPRLSRCTVQAACDVDNPLCGCRGASAIFGPQKGATPAMVERLDANLRHWAAVIAGCLEIDILRRPGAGAAGGLGAGLMAFTGAELRTGIDIVMEASRLAAILREADLVITGEGRIDAQTAFGKTPAGVARLARSLGVPVIAIGGALADDARQVFDAGIDGLAAAVARDMRLEEALRGSKRFLADAAERTLRLIRIGSELKARLEPEDQA